MRELTCHKIIQDFLNAVTTPHVFCDGTNIFVNPNFTRPAECLKHRPNYKCAGEKTYRQYGMTEKQWIYNKKLVLF